MKNFYFEVGIAILLLVVAIPIWFCLQNRAYRFEKQLFDIAGEMANEVSIAAKASSKPDSIKVTVDISPNLRGNRSPLERLLAAELSTRLVKLDSLITVVQRDRLPQQIPSGVLIVTGSVIDIGSQLRVSLFLLSDTAILAATTDNLPKFEILENVPAKSRPPGFSAVSTDKKCTDRASVDSLRLSTQLELLNTKMEWNEGDANSIFFLGTIPLGIIVFALPVLLRTKKVKLKTKLSGYRLVILAGTLLLFLSGLFFVHYARKQMSMADAAAGRIFHNLLESRIKSGEYTKFDIINKMEEFNLWTRTYEIPVVDIPIPSIQWRHLYRIAQIMQISGYLIYIVLFADIILSGDKMEKKDM